MGGKTSSIVASEVLLISSDPDYGKVLSGMLRSISISIEQVNGLKEAQTKIHSGQYAVVLTEAHLPDGTWLDVLELVGVFNTVIVTDPVADARLWAEVLNRGAYDLIVQPFASGEVQRILGHACSRASTIPKRIQAG